jgi:hypothetical protein
MSTRLEMRIGWQRRKKRVKTENPGRKQEVKTVKL